MLSPVYIDIDSCIQNADDARARDVSFVIDSRTHGTVSLLNRALRRFQV